MDQSTADGPVILANAGIHPKQDGFPLPRE